MMANDIIFNIDIVLRYRKNTDIDIELSKHIKTLKFKSIEYILYYECKLINIIERNNYYENKYDVSPRVNNRY